jgi:hypothetical protein
MKQPLDWNRRLHGDDITGVLRLLCFPEHKGERPEMKSWGYPGLYPYTS